MSGSVADVAKDIFYSGVSVVNISKESVGSSSVADAGQVGQYLENGNKEIEARSLHGCRPMTKLWCLCSLKPIFLIFD